jgi:ribonucleoside-diphosphate reductase alpha subunit
MIVIKRNGNAESVSFDKVTHRIEKLCTNLNVNPHKVAQRVFGSMIDQMHTHTIDSLSADVASSMTTEHPDYDKLASRILASNLQKKTPRCFTDAMIMNRKLLSRDFIKYVSLTHDTFIHHERDFDFTYFGFKTLMNGYLMPNETPQYMFMRVAIAIHKDDISRVKETYEYMSRHYFIHASPTLFNAGTPNPQMSSCFLVASKGDSIDGIYDTIKECAQISKWSGGIGVHIHDIRAKGSQIRGTNGVSDGIIPMLRVYNNTARYVNQGGHRKGAIAVYLEPWHADIMDFLELRLNQGDEEARCRDLFTALWIPDMFMRAVHDDINWYLMCPDECPGLSDVFDEEFDILYYKYVSEKRFKKIVKARDVWNAMIKSQVETGTPYMLYKDRINRNSNQQNLGTIKSSNLCCEITEYSNPAETAVCNLASISLPKMIKDSKFDFEELKVVTRILVRNLNKVIDNNFYPTFASENSNTKHRPIAIGVQGLADVFMMLKYAWGSKESRQLNIDIFKTIYLSALEESCEQARLYGCYESYRGCPIDCGVFHTDSCNVDCIPQDLREGVCKYGLRNSLLVAPMPTASTSQILGNNECFEPYTSNMYVRRTLAGEFIVMNKHLVKDLVDMGLWNKDTKDAIIQNNGSVENLNIPDKLKELYKTVWEISQKVIIDMASDRTPYIDQSQSMNLHLEDATETKVSSMLMYGWKKGLKTGLYYLRTRPKTQAIQVTIACTRECTSCSA